MPVSSEALPMKRTESEYVTAKPARRPLKIFATDPMLGRTAGNRITLEVENETLQPGPLGERIEVIDFDGSHQRFYPAVNLDNPAILMQGGRASRAWPGDRNSPSRRTASSLHTKGCLNEDAIRNVLSRVSR